MENASIPQSVDIMGLTYKVAVGVVSRDADGVIDPYEQAIIISGGMTPERTRQTFVHEVVHGIFEQMGRNDLYGDEQLTCFLSIALCGAFPEIARGA